MKRALPATAVLLLALAASAAAAEPAFDTSAGKVTVTTRDGRTLRGRVDEPKGDPGNTLTREEIGAKFERLAAFSQAADANEARRLLANAWRIAETPRVGALFAQEAPA